MPMYVLECKCGEQIEKICSSFEKIKEVVCPKCNAVGEFRVIPARSKFKIFGYSADNGYSMSNMRYDD